MDQRKLNEIMQRIEVISEGELNIKVHLYEQLLPYTLGWFGYYDNAIEFLKEAERGPEAPASSASSASSAASASSVSSASSASSAPSRVSRFSQAPVSSVSSASMAAPSSAAYASMPGGGSGFAPTLIPSTPGMGGYALGAGREGSRFLRAPLNLSGLKKGRRNTRRHRR
jgi:hypothetical protein